MSEKSLYTPIRMTEIATPSATPASGETLLYPKSDGSLYIKTNSGESVVGGGGAGGTEYQAGNNITITGSPADTINMEPSGSDTQIQFNNSGVLGASANLTWDGSNMTIAGGIYLSDSNFPVISGERTGTGNNALYGVFKCKTKTTSDMIDGIGTGMWFYLEDSSSVENYIGNIHFERAGADNTGEFVIRPAVSGTGQEMFNLSGSGCVINEAGRDMDFRIESNDYTYMIYMNGNDNRVGIGNDSVPTSSSIPQLLQCPQGVYGKDSYITHDMSGISQTSSVNNTYTFTPTAYDQFISVYANNTGSGYATLTINVDLDNYEISGHYLPIYIHVGMNIAVSGPTLSCVVNIRDGSNNVITSMTHTKSNDPELEMWMLELFYDATGTGGENWAIIAKNNYKNV